MSDVTRLPDAIEHGDSASPGRLVGLVYDELRRLAAAQLAREAPGQTLDATALVHEAYLRLAPGQPFANRRHFFAAAAEAMRRILIDRARARKSLKRGGDGLRLPLDDVAGPDADDRLLALDEALSSCTILPAFRTSRSRRPWSSPSIRSARNGPSLGPG